MTNNDDNSTLVWRRLLKPGEAELIEAPTVSITQKQVLMSAAEIRDVIIDVESPVQAQKLIE